MKIMGVPLESREYCRSSLYIIYTLQVQRTLEEYNKHNDNEKRNITVIGSKLW